MNKFNFRALIALALAFLIPTFSVAQEEPISEEGEGDILPLWENLPLLTPSSFAAIGSESLPPEDPPESEPGAVMALSLPTPNEEIAALADALGNDPVRIFNHVRNHIDYEHYYGLRKGALLTLMEGSGNDFDQCELLAELLKAAGYSNVNYRFRIQRFNYAGNNGVNLTDWMGLASEPYPGKTFAEAFPNTTLPSDFDGASDLIKKRFAWAATFLTARGNSTPLYDPANLTVLYFDRLWLELTVGTTIYKLDPSFKRYEKISGIDGLLANAGYSRATLLATAGGTTGTAHVNNLNNANIKSFLASLNTAVLAQLQATAPNATMAEIMRGRRIIPVEVTSLSQAFPAEELFHGNGTLWSSIPSSHKTTVRFETGSMNYVTPTASLNGQRIALSFDGNNIRLWLDDTQVATTTNSAATFPLKITVTHPGVNISAKSETKTYKKNNAYAYAIIYGFTASGKQLQRRYEVLKKYKDIDLLADDSRQVRAEILNIMGLTWMYQTELVARLLAEQNHCLYANHHRFGRMAQEQGFYVDVGLQLSGVVPFDGVPDARYENSFHLAALFCSALEHGIIEQMQPGSSAVSTVNIIRKASNADQNIYKADASNWSTVAAALSGYTSKNTVYDKGEPYTDSNSNGRYDTGESFTDQTLKQNLGYLAQNTGAVLLLPRSSSITQGDWSGTGYVVRSPDEAGMIISGGYSGGYSTSYGYVSSPSISTSSFYNPTYSYTSPTIPVIPVPPPSVFTPSYFGSDPVDMATGAFVYAHTDLVTGVAPAPEGLDFSRQYSTLSRDKESQNLGFGWTHALHIRAVERTSTEEALGLGTPQQASALLTAYFVAADLYRSDANAKEWTTTVLTVAWFLDQMKDNAVSITIGDQSFQFIKQPDGTYTPPAGSTMTLTKVSDKFELRQRLGNVIKFDTEGKVTSITDPDNRSLTFAYNTNDTINYVQDAYGRRLTFTYTTTTPKRITKVTDSTDSRYVEFRYDTSGNLDRVTDPEGKFSYYDYALTGDPASTADEHRIRRLRNHDDQTITVNVYDALGRVSEQYLHGDTNKTYKLRYTGYANTEENPAGGLTTYFYDERGRATGSRDPSGKINRWTYNGQDQIVTKTSPVGETTEYHYDGNNNLTQIDHPRGGGSTYHVYDSLGRIDLTTDAEGHQIDYIYFTSGTDATKNRPYQIIDPAGTTTFQYYASGSGAIGKLWKSTDSQSLVTEYAYDGNGQPDWIKGPGGFKTDFQYTARGDLDYQDDPNLIRTDYTYNNRRQVTQIVSNLGGPDAATENFTYDNMGLLETTTAPPHNSGLRAQTKQTYSPTEKLRYTYLVNDTPSTSDDLLTEIRYDNRDWQEKTLDAAARETSIVYLPNGKVWKTNVPLARQSVSNYDDDGRPTLKTLPGSSADRTFGFAYSTTSTAAGDITQGYPKAVFTDADLLVTKTEHDRLGQVRYVNNKLNKTFEFRYDGLGRQTHIITPLDAANSRAHQVAYNHRGAPTLVTEPSGQNATFTYAPTTGRLSSVAYTDGTLTETVNYSLYDNNGNLKTISEGSQTLQRTFDNRDRVKTYTDANSQQLGYRYYPSGALQKIIYPGGNDTVGHVEYTYYQTGRLKEVIDRLNAPTVTRTTTYYWNNDGRLARVVRPNGTERRITYDAAGRPELVEEFATAGAGRLISAYKNGYYPSDEVQWTYALPKPHPVTAAPGAVGSMTYRSDNSLGTFEGQSVIHDADGNMTNGPLPDGTFSTYGYDIRNRLLSAGGITYGYDPEGGRTSAADATGTTTYVTESSLGVSKVLARTKSGQTTRYIWGAGLLYEVDASGNAIYYHYDQVGSTTALTNSAAEVIERIEYAPFGWITYRSNKNGTPHDTPFLYTGFFGNQTDANGLIYMRARYYNPLTRRFLNSDPAREGGNWYAYAAGNPLAFVDPTGLGIDGALDSVQTALSYLGMIPVFGEAFDVLNAGISIVRGNYGDAALNLASALPGIGNVVGGAKIAATTGKLFGAAENAASIIMRSEKSISSAGKGSQVLLDTFVDGSKHLTKPGGVALTVRPTFVSDLGRGVMGNSEFIGGVTPISRISNSAFANTRELLDTVVHEELHLRIGNRILSGDNAALARRLAGKEEDYVRAVLERYMRNK